MGSAHLDRYENPSKRVSKKDLNRSKKRNHLVKEIFDGNYIPKSETPKTVYRRKQHVDWTTYTDDDD